MLIVYCETCGKRVPDADVDSGRATQIAENQWLCGACSPAATATAPAVDAPAPAPGSTTRYRKTLTATTRKNSDLQPSAAQHPAQIKLLLIAGAGALVVGVLLILLLGIGRKKDPALANSDAPAPKPTPVLEPSNAPPVPDTPKQPPTLANPVAPSPATPPPAKAQPETQAAQPASLFGPPLVRSAGGSETVDRAKQVEKEIEDYRNGRAQRLLEEAQEWFKQNAADPWSYKARLTDITRSYSTAPAATAARKLLDELKSLPPPPDRLESSAPESKEYVLVYDADLSRASSAMPYETDHHAEITSPFDRVAYFMELQSNSGETQWIYVSMDAFTDSLKKVGVPTFASGAKFQQNVTNLNVLSNVKGIVAGTGLTGNIEFWPNNYGSGNAKKVPNAAGDKYDFGDDPSNSGDYGSMQVHNYEARQTLFAFNRWNNGGGEMGIGNQPGGNPDWTFSNNAGNYRTKRLRVLVRLKK